MAFTTSLKLNLTSTSTDLYTSPANTTSIIFNGFVANKSETDTAYFTMTYTSGTSTITLLNLIPIPVGSTVLIPKKVVSPNAKVSGKVDTITSGSVDVSLEILTV